MSCPVSEIRSNFRLIPHLAQSVKSEPILLAHVGTARMEMRCGQNVFINRHVHVQSNASADMLSVYRQLAT